MTDDLWLHYESRAARPFLGTKGVLKGLARIAKICPFVITHAEPKELHAAFLRKLTPDQVAAVARLVLLIAPETTDMVEQRAGGVAGSIATVNGFFLYWA